jgi:tetratricopeptide (TPR) repeat protein
MPDPMNAYQWLTFLEGSHLSESTSLWIEPINAAFRTRKTPQRVRSLVERVLKMRETFSDSFEKAEVIVKCALAFYRLNQYPEAIQLLKEAEAIYQRNLHYIAVVLWMEGCIQWQISSEHDQACLAWKRSLEIFGKLHSWSTDPAHIDWYNQRVQEVRDNIIAQVGLEYGETGQIPETLKVDETGPIPVTVNIAVTSPTSGTQQVDKTGPTLETPGLNETLLQLFRVVEKVPAGGFGPVGYDSITIGDVEVSQVKIDGRSYRIANLRGPEKLIRLPAKRYVVIKVNGDSMNNPSGKTSVPIDNGDYVLLVEQKDARSEDIVAAEIDNVDSCATLKRFRIIQPGALYRLEPESTNASNQPFEFTRLDQAFHIRGVALAVFKPI